MAATKTPSAPQEAKLVDGPIFTMIASQEGEDISVKTEFNQTVSGRELLSVMKTSVCGLLQTTVKLGKAYGLSEDQVVEYLFSK